MFPSSTKRKIRHTHVARSRETTAEKCMKKHDALTKLLFYQSKSIAFLPFSLPSPSPSSLLKVPRSRNSKTVARWNISYDCAHAWRSHGTGEETEKKLWVSQNWKLLFDCISAPKKIPPNVKAVATGATSIRVTWTEITNDNFLTGYTVKYTENTERDVVRSKKVKGVGELVLQPLKIFTNYTIEVAARSSTQDGKFSEAILVTTLEDGKLSFLYIFIWETF